ncbi:hypothetical protein [Sorangium atrum]|uniref:Uncharacterized protein n=1 Tax=Sorangium atrum TaxID=2995308 RepID=A0ABT5C5Z6_9BACT|nr:hypothetical protein [Sorangium aterium]MDC0681179.1 hypothetical protein [Sorangium aterium]
MAPHERLAIGEERLPGERDPVGVAVEVAPPPVADVAEQPEREVVALRGPAGRLAGGALEQARGEASLRERAGRWRGDPVARQLAPRGEQERERSTGMSVPAGSQSESITRARIPAPDRPRAEPAAMRVARATNVAALPA